MAPKKAAAPAPAPVVEEATLELEVGDKVVFLGYADDVPDEERVLEAEAVYEVVDFAEETGNAVVRFDNPDFNAKKKEHPETNPKYLEVEVFPEEIELLGEEAEETAVEEEVAPPPPPQKAPRGSKAAAAPAAEAAPAGKGKAAAGKGKAAAPAAGKGKGKAAAPAPKAEEQQEDPEALPELDNEDPEVLALVEGAEDLIAVAQDLESSIGTNEYHLGGVLYHIKKNKEHLNVEGGKEYAEAGGWKKFLMDYFNIDYRKAMYLVNIYVNFSLAGIEAPADHVAKIGWTKASKISDLLNKEGQDPAELIELAETNSVSDLTEILKDQVIVGGGAGKAGEGGNPVARVVMKFKYMAAEAEAITSILEGAKAQLGLKDVGEAMAHIVSEWGAENLNVKEDVKEETAPKQTGRAAGKAGGKKVTA